MSEIIKSNRAPRQPGSKAMADMVDSRIIGLLKAIDQSGSSNQAAKQLGLSYKGG